MRYRELGNTRVLANWQPSAEAMRRGKWQVHAEFTERVRELIGTPGKVSSHDVYAAREPGFTNQQPRVWHQDCEGKAQYLVVWSNIIPTLVRYPDGRMLEARDGDIILINNREVEHQVPVDVNEGRWFMRMRISDGNK